jgi:predicted GTPase
MSFGAGVLAARREGAAELVDPRPYAVDSIARTFERHPHVGPLLPAMGYGADQLRDLAETIRRAKPDLVVVATPVDLRRLLKLNVPMVRVDYALAERGRPNLEDVLRERLGPRLGLAQRLATDRR